MKLSSLSATLFLPALALVLHAAPGIPFVLTGVGNGNVLDGVYISPYTATVNGVVGTPVICDDFEDEVQIGESWKATTGTIGTSSSTTGLFGAEKSQGYQEVAWLSEQLFANPSNAGSISYAIWAVFDPGTSTTYGVSTTGVSGWLNAYHDTTTFQAVFGTGGLLSQAQAATQTSADFPGITVYTPVANTQSCCGRPQEFLVVSAAEAPAPVVLGIEFLGLGIMLYVFRRSRFAGR